MSTALDAARSVAVQVAAAVQAAAPSPSPTSNVPDELEVTPGLLGFLATFALAAACVVLFLSLTRHLRRAGRNARERGLPVDEPKRRGPGTPAQDAEAGQGTARDETVSASPGAPDDTPPDSPVDWPDDRPGTSSS